MPDERLPVERARASGQAAFGRDWTPDRVAHAPGRLELLGNHVDYNGGNVLAAAIDRSVAVAVAASAAPETVEIVFADVEGLGSAQIQLGGLVDWRNHEHVPAPADYLRGAIAALVKRELIDLRRSLQVAVAGDVPIGLGLSSSAALCVAFVLALASQTPVQRDVVLLAQEAEHRAGTPCGTMDQSSSLAGGFIRFDAKRVSFVKLEPDLGDHVFAIADSGVTRVLSQSSYPLRVEESKSALEIVNRELGHKYENLAEVSRRDLETLEDSADGQLPSVLLRRIRHVVRECERVELGYEALKAGDWIEFGRLMTLSGRSSALDYEISHPRVEELVRESLTVDGVLGARMMGGGEGGVALILARRSTVPALERTLDQGYYARNALPTTVYVLQPAPGANVRDVT